MVDLVEEVKEVFTKFRTERDISQADAGALLGIGQTGYSAFETGRSNPSARLLSNALKVLVKEGVMWVGGARPCRSCGLSTPVLTEGCYHCIHCGTVHRVKCHECGYVPTDENAQFCQQCGTRIGEAVCQV